MGRRGLGNVAGLVMEASRTRSRTSPSVRVSRSSDRRPVRAQEDSRTAGARPPERRNGSAWLPGRSGRHEALPHRSKRTRLTHSVPHLTGLLHSGKKLVQADGNSRRRFSTAAKMGGLLREGCGTENPRLGFAGTVGAPRQSRAAARTDENESAYSMLTVMVAHVRRSAVLTLDLRNDINRL